MEDVAFDCDGRTVAFLSAGAAPPTIVLVHGAATSPAPGTSCSPGSPPSGGVVAPDLAGHGRSDDHPVDGPTGYHEDLLRLLDGVEGPIVLVGHSLGAPVALAFEPRPLLEEAVLMAARGRRPDNPYLDLRLYSDVAVPTIALQALQGNQEDARETVDELLGANPLVDVRWVDASHSVHWDRPDAVIDAVRELLDR